MIVTQNTQYVENHTLLFAGLFAAAKLQMPVVIVALQERIECGIAESTNVHSLNLFTTIS